MWWGWPWTSDCPPEGRVPDGHAVQEPVLTGLLHLAESLTFGMSSTCHREKIRTASNSRSSRSCAGSPARARRRLSKTSRDGVGSARRVSSAISGWYSARHVGGAAEGRPRRPRDFEPSLQGVSPAATRGREPDVAAPGFDRWLHDDGIHVAERDAVGSPRPGASGGLGSRFTSATTSRWWASDAKELYPLEVARGDETPARDSRSLRSPRP